MGARECIVESTSLFSWGYLVTSTCLIVNTWKQHEVGEGLHCEYVEVKCGGWPPACLSRGDFQQHTWNQNAAGGGLIVNTWIQCGGCWSPTWFLPAILSRSSRHFSIGSYLVRIDDYLSIIDYRSIHPLLLLSISFITRSGMSIIHAHAILFHGACITSSSQIEQRTKILRPPKLSTT